MLLSVMVKGTAMLKFFLPTIFLFDFYQAALMKK